MAAGGRDLKLTQDEITSLGKALKNEEFRKLLFQYAEEINDPENKCKYEAEITELERQKGIDVTFINPEPGYVLKTSVHGVKKAFINICKNDKVGKPKCQPCVEVNRRGLNWSIPYTQAPPREDTDKNGNKCMVYDVVFHPDTYYLAVKNYKMKKLVEDTALDGVERSFKVKLDRKNIRYPKMQFKGTPTTTTVRRVRQDHGSDNKKITENPSEDFGLKKFPLCSLFAKTENKVHASKAKSKGIQDASDTQLENEKTLVFPLGKNENEDDDIDTTYTEPKYVIKHQKDLDLQDYQNRPEASLNATRPKRLIIEIELPLLSSTIGVKLDIQENQLLLQCDSPAKYKLKLLLSYPVDEENGSAKFDKSKHKLTVILPVKPVHDMNVTYTEVKSPIISELTKEDNGVEFNTGYQTLDPDCGSYRNRFKDQIVLQGREGMKISRSEEIPVTDKPDDKDYKETTLQSGDISSPPNFLLPSISYSFPQFTCTQCKEVIIFVLNVKNVEPGSLQKQLSGNSGLHVQFSSLGSGFVPLYYAFLIKFPEKFSISEETTEIEVWDNNVVIQFPQANDYPVSSYYVGLKEDELERHSLPDISDPGKTTKKMKWSEREVCQTGNANAEVTGNLNEESAVCGHRDNQKEEDVFFVGTKEENRTDLDASNIAQVASVLPVNATNEECSPVNHEKKADRSNSNSSEVISGRTVTEGAVDDKKRHSSRESLESTLSDSALSTARVISQIFPTGYKQMSEFSDEMSLSPTGSLRSILKTRFQHHRSLSESNVDDYKWSSQEMCSQSADSDIPEENMDEGVKVKKTVRFNEVVSHQLFRSNAGILQQRKIKSHLRKLRKKQRLRERRFSESETSETELDLSQNGGLCLKLNSAEKKGKAEKENIKKMQSQGADSITGTKECNEKQSMKDVQHVQTKFVAEDNAVDIPEESICSSEKNGEKVVYSNSDHCQNQHKTHRRKKKKKNDSKSPALKSMDISHCTTRAVELTNDLIFDLDV